MLLSTVHLLAMHRAHASVDAGPFRAEMLPEESRYTLRDGHRMYCSPSGGQHARANAVGALALASDPAASEVGVDAGYQYAPGSKDIDAPDIAVGHVPNAPGWILGAPPLAVEYADRGQNERELQDKIQALHGHGTQWVWVVRLVGPRRVEVYEKGKAKVIKTAGEQLFARPHLQNAVPVEALYDKAAALDVTLANLLNRKGYASLEAVRTEGEAKGRTEGEAKGRTEGEAKGRAEGRTEGEAKGLREAVLVVCELLAISPTDTQLDTLRANPTEQLAVLLAHLRQYRAWPEP